MLPMRLDCATVICPCITAVMPTWSQDSVSERNELRTGLALTIISTALPRITFRRPPKTGPARFASLLVDTTIKGAKGMMAKKLRMNVTIGSQLNSPAASPRGTKTKSVFHAEGTRG